MAFMLKSLRPFKVFPLHSEAVHLSAHSSHPAGPCFSVHPSLQGLLEIQDTHRPRTLRYTAGLIGPSYGRCVSFFSSNPCFCTWASKINTLKNPRAAFIWGNLFQRRLLHNSVLLIQALLWHFLLQDSETKNRFPRISMRVHG